MRFVADLHVHSRYSRATSREADLAGYYRWARIKGIDVVGTGDFTHPRWFEELSTNLVEDNGLYRLREPPRDDAGAGGGRGPGGGADGLGGSGTGGGPTAGGTGSPAGAGRAVRFMLTTEISSIYRKHGQVRKVHTLVCLQDLEEVRRLTVKLAAIGNIASDGRPILGLDPKDLLSMVMEVSAEGFLIPAHVWTPWFSVFGSKSGFDAIEECFEELTPHIFALETGLSSDPPMNWRWSALDRFRLVSNSDAHSPGNLGREATLLDTDPSWTGIRDALRTGTGFLGTVEFYPEEGKYHWDGHRKCGVCMDPEQSARAGGNCPVCGKPLTIGVLNRVLGLADREAPAQPRPMEGYRYIIPLPELLAELVGTGAGSAGVARAHARVLSSFGSEFAFLLEAPIRDIERSQGPLLAEAVRRMREGQVDPQPGYDGEFGVIRLFDRSELDRLRGQDELFPAAARGRGRTTAAATAPAPDRPAATAAPPADVPPATATLALDPDQQAIVDAAGARSVVFAGPGTGKTRLLAAWIARHALSGALALTFTNRAAGERTPGIPPLVSARGPGERVRIVRTANPAEEGRFIAQAITDLVGGVDAVSVDAARKRGAGRYGFSDIAVLFRTRAVRDALLPSLAASGLPLSTGTAAPLTDDEPFRSFAAALRLLADERDAVSLRILARSCGAEALKDLDSRRYDLVRLAADLGVAAAMDMVRASVVPIDLSDPALAVGWETLRAAAAAYATDLRGFTAHVSLCARESEGPRAVQRICLLTFHAAKGLEFPVVFIAGAEDEVTPGRAGSRARGPQDSPESAEERRLFYVAVTRARDILFVTRCARRATHGEITAATPSRFLADIPARCRTDLEPSRRPRESQLPLFG